MIEGLASLAGNILGSSIGNVAIAAGVGGTLFGLAYKGLDVLIKPIILFIFSKETFILNIVRYLDDNIIDILKKKTPESGREIEIRLNLLLDRLKQIINDTETKRR